MGDNRALIAFGRTGRITKVSCVIMSVCGLFVTMQGVGQVYEMATGARIAEKIENVSLTAAALILAGLCVGAVVYMAKTNLQIHKENVSERRLDRETQVALQNDIHRIAKELERRPCFVSTGPVKLRDDS